MISETDVTNIYQEEQRKNDILKDALSNAESANKAKLNFLSNMSHDIRTPMNAIIGMTELAMESVDNREKVMQYLNIIETSSNHLLSLINDILVMSKIENDKIILIKEKVNIPMQLDNIRKITEAMFKEKNQEFSIKIVNLVHENIIADGIRINRVMINLLNNACKFTPRKGKIELKIIEIPTSNNKYANIRILVSDNCIGIPKEKISKVFNPFYSDNYSQNMENEGTGLGLTIAKSIVEANGGIISIDSELEKGTVIMVNMHFQIDASSRVQGYNKTVTKNDIKYDLTGKKILLVEDNCINQIVAKTMLEKYGAKVEIADDGYVGFEKFVNSMENEYDMILMDIQMPVMNGYEATRAIRESKHGRAKDVPIIAMSANVFPEDEIQSINSGMNCHIGKPITIHKLMDCINKYSK